MEVLSVSLTDQQKPVDGVRTRTFFILDDCLDENILKNALDHLIRDHWRKLGARLVKRPKDGLLEYHLPQTFSENHVLFNWSSEEYNHSITKFTSVLQRPPGNGMILFPSVASIDKKFSPDHWPFERKDEPTNAPLLYVHLSLFPDATAIAISCPHVVVDQCGMANIMRAWLGLTRGEDPPPMVGYNKDVLPNEKLYTDCPKTEVFRKGRPQVRRKMDYIFIILGFIPDMLLNPRERSYVLFVPLPLVQSLRERCSKTLKEKYGIDPCLSSGDILTAILMKFSRMHSKSSRTITLSQTVNLRGRIPQLDKGCHAFIHNALQFGTARFRIDASTPISEIAYLNRQAVIQSLEPKEIETSLAVTREMVRCGQPIHFSEPFEQSYSVTSWSVAWKGLNFSSTTKGTRGKSKERTGLKMVVLGQANLRKAPCRFASTIMCRTEEGFWCDFGVSLKNLKLIQEHLAKDPMLQSF